MKRKPSVQITLTSEQQVQIQQVTGKKLSSLALKPEALEARVAPGTFVN